MNTKPAPLPYPAAPLTKEDIILQTVRFEEQFLSHLVYTPSEETMRKEINLKPTTMSRQMFLSQVMRFAQSIVKI